MSIANPSPDWQTALCKRASLSLQQMIQQHRELPVELQSELQNQLGMLTGLQNKLSQNLIQIAVFGFVSRGKSAVLNALFAEPIFPVGPLNGETQWPRSVRWSPALANMKGISLQIELIDTPGLDEIEGQGRAQMARDIASTADLILFIVAGMPTPEELAALAELRQVQRPILMVVNKADLYPQLTAAAVYEKLSGLQGMLTPHEILLTAAAPAAVSVRSQWPDGRSTEEWEVPSPDVASLRHALIELLQREGQVLLTVNTLLQTEAIECEITLRVADYHAASAEVLIGQFWVVKGVAISLFPFLFLDLIGGALFDLLLVGALVRRYRLPTTRYQVDKIWRQLFLNTGSLLLAEAASGILFGLGHASVVDDGGGLLPLLGGAIAQAGVSAYGAYRIGHATQTYLRQGATWGATGPSTLIYQMLQALKPDMLLYRLRDQLTSLPISVAAPD
ncbi:MAG: GTP-binding protein [Thermosynechococcaceae cyanobacterium]